MSDDLPNNPAPAPTDHEHGLQEDLSERARSLGFDPEDPKSLIRAAKRARAIRASLARKDPNFFCQYVLRDERTSKAIAQAPMHETWHTLLSQHDRLNIWSHVEGGKTNQVAIGRTLYELGRDPSLKVAIISNTNDLAKKITRQLGQYIQKSPQLHEVFPALVPTDDPTLPWRAQALTVKRPGMGAKDPSIQAAGMHGNIIGSRIDLLILDDVLDFENTNTPAPREDAYRWLKYIMGRMTEGGRVWVIGNAWHPDDAMHRFEKDGFYSVRFPVILPDGKITWPERWSMDRIVKARGPSGLGPLEFARQLMCQARDDTSARFKREWVDLCIEKGRGCRFLENINQLFDEQNLTEEERSEYAEATEAIWRLSGKGGILTGVDLAVQKGDSNDETVLFTIFVDGSTGMRRVLSVRAGKWTGPEIIQQIVKCHEDFGGMFIVENNAAQAYIAQFLQAGTAIPVVPFTTGRNKAHPEFGVEALATELANGKWQIPSHAGADGKPVMHKEVMDWVSELLFYDPKEHTGDRVMASWFAREGARRFVDSGTGDGSVGVRTF
jgi:hypothetical protein